MSEPNEQIEWFKRFAAAHMRWVNFSFDRIVQDVVKKHSEPDPPPPVRVAVGHTVTFASGAGGAGTSTIVWVSK